MKRLILVITLMMSTLFATSQAVRVSFTGVDLNGSRFPIDTVSVSNITRGWTETLVYPDLTIVLSRLGVPEVDSDLVGIVNVYPNPSTDHANVEFGIAEAGRVGISVFGIDGVQKAFWEGRLQAGLHHVRVMLDKPQMALVVVNTEKERYVAKLLQIGNGSGNLLEFHENPIVSQELSSRSDRLDAYGGFEPGDVFSFVGKGTTAEGTVVTSDTEEMDIFEDETVTLVFPVETPPTPGVQSLPYFQSFESEFGTYKTYDVEGAQSWEIDYNTAKMTGYVDGTYNANEDWLISSPVDLTGVNEAKMTMVYIGRFFNNINEEVTVWASTDYVDGDNPATARWIQVPSTLTEGNNWNDFATTEIALADVTGQPLTGQILTFAVKYLSSDEKAGTMEIQSIFMEEGGVTPPTPPTPGTGSGTFDDPYNVAAGINQQSNEPIAWVHGYIVGAVKSGVTSVSSNDQINWTGPFDSQTNVVIADDLSRQDITQCIIVNLPAGKPLRTQVNLQDHPENLGKQLSVYGKLRAYFGQAGLRDSGGTENDFVLEGALPPTPPTPGGEVQDLPYFQSFATEFGTYMTYDVEGPQSWEIAYSTAKMTGYVDGTYYANEDWLISSPVDLTSVNEAKMTMVYIGRFFEDINEEVTVWASADYVYGDNPTTATWTQVYSTLTEGNNWNDFATAEIVLADVTGQPLVGQIVTFAVKYLSSDEKAGTMEIQSISFEEGGVTPPTPGTGSGTADDPYNVAKGISLQGQDIVGWVHGYIVGAVKNGVTAVSSNDQINWSGSFDSPTNVVIADDPNCQEITQCIIVNLPANKPLRTQVNLQDNPGNLGKQLAVNGKLRAYFGQAGLRDSGGTENDFVLEGGTPPTPPTPGVIIFSETFGNSQGNFTIQNVSLPAALTYVWAHSSEYSCMKASAFVNCQAYATESWLVSPPIDMFNYNTASLVFEQAVNYASPTGALSVMISSDYVDNVTTATWTELDMNAWPAGNNWTFISSTADLTPYSGQIVYIAFKYTSTSSASATWEVKNLTVTSSLK